MRIISGTLKGRNIKGYNIEGTRPTMDRVKASVFGSIQDYVSGSMVLDLFAGTGNLGIEAISNGCKYVYFIDNNKICTHTIQKNLNTFKVDNKASVMNLDYLKALEYFRDNNIVFDLIFIDPPYNYKNIDDVVDIIDNYDILSHNGILVLEFKYDKVNLDAKKYYLRKSKKYGDKFVYIYRRCN